MPPARLSQSALGAQGDVSAMQQQVVYQDELLCDTITSRALMTLPIFLERRPLSALGKCSGLSHFDVHGAAVLDARLVRGYFGDDVHETSWYLILHG